MGGLKVEAERIDWGNIDEFDDCFKAVLNQTEKELANLPDNEIDAIYNSFKRIWEKEE